MTAAGGAKGILALALVYQMWKMHPHCMLMTFLVYSSPWNIVH